MLGQVICQSLVDVLNGLGAKQVHRMEKLAISSQVSVLSPLLAKLDDQKQIWCNLVTYSVPETWDSMALLKLNGGRLRSRHQDINEHTVLYRKA